MSFEIEIANQALISGQAGARGVDNLVGVAPECELPRIPETSVGVAYLGERGISLAIKEWIRKTLIQQHT